MVTNLGSKVTLVPQEEFSIASLSPGCRIASNLALLMNQLWAVSWKLIIYPTPEDHLRSISQVRAASPVGNPIQALLFTKIEEIELFHCAAPISPECHHGLNGLRSVLFF